MASHSANTRRSSARLPRSGSSSSRTCPARGPSTRTTWSVEAATARGGVNSWFVGGTYATVVADSHGVEVHSSYSRQTSAAANGVGVYGLEDDGRSAAGVAVIDHWTISPRAMVDVGGRYERHDYLRDPGLFSPTIIPSYTAVPGSTKVTPLS